MRVSRIVPRNFAFTTHFFPSSHRRELGILPASPPPFFKPTAGEMYSHLQAQHPESLEIGERDWKMELFGMDSFTDQQQ